MNKIKIGNKEIGEKVYVIAEAGVNHNGSLDRAKELIIAAAKAGADAIKFQTYTADELVVKGTPKFWDWKGDKDKESQYDAYKAIGGFGYENYPEMIKCCKENNIEFISTPFSFEAAEKLNSFGVNAFKIASSDMSTLPFLEYVAKFGKPIILSTGASTMEEIHEAVDTIEYAGNIQIIILHCTLCYPTAPEDMNLNVIKTLEKEFPMYPIGISDHTLGATPSVVAAGFGAKMIEKHFTIDKTLPDSADHWLSVDPVELKEIVDGVNKKPYTVFADRLGGSHEKKIFECEKETRKYDKRSIVSAKDIKEGDIITADMITYKRPGTGIWPKFHNIVVGKKAIKDIAADTTITWEMIG